MCVHAWEREKCIFQVMFWRLKSVCMCVCRYMCARICVYACAHTCMCVCVCVCVCVCTVSGFNVHILMYNNFLHGEYTHLKPFYS